MYQLKNSGWHFETKRQKTGLVRTCNKKCSLHFKQQRDQISSAETIILSGKHRSVNGHRDQSGSELGRRFTDFLQPQMVTTLDRLLNRNEDGQLVGHAVRESILR